MTVLICTLLINKIEYARTASRVKANGGLHLEVGYQKRWYKHTHQVHVWMGSAATVVSTMLSVSALACANRKYIKFREASMYLCILYLTLHAPLLNAQLRI